MPLHPPATACKKNSARPRRTVKRSPSQTPDLPKTVTTWTAWSGRGTPFLLWHAPSSRSVRRQNPSVVRSVMPECLCRPPNLRPRMCGAARTNGDNQNAGCLYHFDHRLLLVVHGKAHHHRLTLKRRGPPFHNMATRTRRSAEPQNPRLPRVRFGNCPKRIRGPFQSAGGGALPPTAAAAHSAMVERRATLPNLLRLPAAPFWPHAPHIPHFTYENHHHRRR